MLSEGWKCYFRDPIFQNLPREHASGRTPLASQAFGARDCPSPPPPRPSNKSNLATAL